MNKPKNLPEGRIGRLARYASLGARASARLLFSKEEDTVRKVAEHAADVLGNMRGLAAKVGQMASYVDGFVPEPQREAFETALKSLRNAAPSSSPEAIRNVVEEEFSAPIDKLFHSWEAEPFASASIGQVHRATLMDGRRVAVKVQHPGIEKAIESDLANAGVFKSLVSTFGPKNVKPEQVFAEVEQRFREELDYELEAKRQKFFIQLHAGDEHIHIPEVIANRSGKRVLSTELAEGKTLDEAALSNETTRRQFALVLWRFVFKGNLVGGMFNADPHPGNYLFRDDGTITFLDFGCCQPIEGDRHAAALDMHRASISKDETAFKAATIRMLETKGGTFEKLTTRYTRTSFEPLFQSPHLISRESVRGLVEGIKEMKQAVFSKDGSFRPLPPGMTFMNRLQFGFYSVLARLHVEADYAEEERQFLVAAHLLS